MLKDLWNRIKPIRRLLGGLLVLVIVWHTFDAVIQPVLVHISPIFADQGEYWTGRYPDTPAQVALVITVLAGLYVYYTLIALIYEGTETFIDMWMGPFALLFLPFFILLVAVPQIIYHQLKRLMFWKQTSDD